MSVAGQRESMAVWGRSAQGTPPRKVRPEVCVCGQDLDVCKGSHCTRCGISLDRVAPAVSFKWSR